MLYFDALHVKMHVLMYANKHELLCSGGVDAFIMRKPKQYTW